GEPNSARMTPVPLEGSQPRHLRPRSAPWNPLYGPAYLPVPVEFVDGGPKPDGYWLGRQLPQRNAAFHQNCPHFRCRGDLVGTNRDPSIIEPEADRSQAWIGIGNFAGEHQVV